MNLVVLSSYSYIHRSRNSFVFFEILFKLDQHLHIAFLLSTVVDCGALTAPANGQVSHPDGTTFGQTATYSCNTGYTLVGDSTRTCEATGWSGDAPTCERMLCVQLQVHVHNIVESSNCLCPSARSTCISNALYRCINMTV